MLAKFSMFSYYLIFQFGSSSSQEKKTEEYDSQVSSFSKIKLRLGVSVLLYTIECVILLMISDLL